MICRKPRSSWADEGNNICMICAFEYIAGLREFTPEQIAAIEKWTVIIRVKDD